MAIGALVGLLIVPDWTAPTPDYGVGQSDRERCYLADKKCSEDAVQFRLAAPDDIESLADLRWRLSTGDLPTNTSLERKEFIAAFCSALPSIEACDSLVHFLAEREGQAIAALSIVKVMKIPRPGNIRGQWGYLTNVYTLPEFRNKGIGAGLLAAARNWAKAQQLELLLVWPSDRSYQFYERAGFRRETDPLTLKIFVEN